MAKYDDYLEQCKEDGVEPLLFDTWKAERMAEGRAAKADQPAVEERKAHAKADETQKELEAKFAAMEAKISALTPEPEEETVPVPMEWGEDGVYRYYSEFKEHALVKKSERAIGPDGRLITSAHVTIQFDANRYSTNDKTIADWIENDAQDHSIGRKEFGWHIFRDQHIVHKPAIHVTDGPKTSIPQQQHRYADRPTPLHANA